MRLTASDRWFIDKVAGQQAGRVVEVLADRSAVLTVMGGGIQHRSLGRDLRDLAVLTGRVLRSRLLRPASLGTDVVYVERTPSLATRRAAYLKRFLGEIRTYGITSASPMAWPGAQGLHVLWATFGAVLRADRREPSELTGAYVDVATSVLQALGHISQASQRRAYLFRPYRLEAPFVAAALMDVGAAAILVVGTTPLGAHIRTLLGSSAVLCTAYQRDEWAHFEPLDRGGRSELWGPTEIVEMEEAYGASSHHDLPDVVGVYSQGFWLRTLLGTIDPESGAPHLALEQRFNSLVQKLAAEQPGVRFVLFPHPMERKRFHETGEHGYGGLLELPNVEASFAEGSSVGSFSKVGLGITTVSTVGFDRLHLGFRTLFFTGGSDFVDVEVPSPFQSLFFTSEGAFANAFDIARRAGHEEFMAEHFGDAYAPDWGPWGHQDRTERTAQ